MSRHFYLPPRRTLPPPSKLDPVLWQRLQLSFTAVGVLAVTLLVWYYFTSPDRWEAPTPVRSYLGSAVPDSSPSAQGMNRPSASGIQTSAQSAVSNTVKADSVNAARQAVLDHPVRLEIWNACGETGLAQKVTAALRGRGTYFDVRGMGNATGGKQEFTSLISRTTDSTLALAVAESLGIASSRIATEIPKSPRDIDVTVVIGADYSRLRLNLKPNSKE